MIDRREPPLSTDDLAAGPMAKPPILSEPLDTGMQRDAQVAPPSGSLWMRSRGRPTARCPSPRRRRLMRLGSHHQTGLTN